MRTLSAIALFVVVLASPSFATPDEVTLKTGEKLVGKVNSVADGKMSFTSDSVGGVTIPLDKVITFSTTEPIAMHFADGTMVNQKVSASTEGMVAIAKEGVLEAQNLPIAQIKKVNPPPVRWTGDLTAGLTITRGNSNTSTGTIDFNAVRRGEDDRIKFEAHYLTGRQEDKTTGKDITTADMIKGALQYDYFFAKSHYAYVNVKGEKDRVAELDLRFQFGAGLGQQWAESDSFNLSTEEGFAFVSENFSNATPDRDYAAGRFAYHMNGKLTAGVKAFTDGEATVSLEDSKNVVADVQAGLRSTLTGSVYAEAKVVYHWVNQPAIGAQRDDVRYVFGVGLSF